jgi:S-adenosylmethionine decarboxylase
VTLAEASGAGGVEWVVEAFGCDAARLADVSALAAFVDELVDALALRPVAPPLWHAFPPPGGVTGLVLLAESHLALHTFPEHGSACVNLFCCVPRPEWDWPHGMARHLAADDVRVRRLDRHYASTLGVA